MKRIIFFLTLLSFSLSSFAYYNLSSREDAYFRCDQYLHSNECGSNNYCINYNYHCDDYNAYSSPFFVAVTDTGGFAERFYYPKSSDCNDPNAVYDPVTHLCTTPVTCPSSGSVYSTIQCVSGNQTITAMNDQTVADPSGCAINVTSSAPYLSADQSKLCVTFTGIATGEQVPGWDVNNIPNGLLKIDDPNVPPAVQPKVDQDFNKDVFPDVVTSGPDSTTTESKVEETVNKPDVISDTQSEYIYKGGIKIKKTTTTLTTVNADGSKTETTTVSYQQITGKKAKLDKSNGAVTVETPPPVVSSTTTTKNYNPSGSLTNQTSSSTGGAGTDNGSISGGNNGTAGTQSDNNNKDDMCDTAEENCEDFKEIIEDAPASLNSSSDIESAINDFNQSADDFTGEIGNNLSDYEIASVLGLDDTLTNMIVSGSCSDLVIPAIDPFFPGVTFSCEKMTVARDFLGWLLYFLTAYFLFDTIVSSSKRSIA